MHQFPPETIEADAQKPPYKSRRTGAGVMSCHDWPDSVWLMCLQRTQRSILRRHWRRCGRVARARRWLRPLLHCLISYASPRSTRVGLSMTFSPRWPPATPTLCHRTCVLPQMTFAMCLHMFLHGILCCWLTQPWMLHLIARGGGSGGQVRTLGGSYGPSRTVWRVNPHEWERRLLMWHSHQERESSNADGLLPAARRKSPSAR